MVMRSNNSTFEEGSSDVAGQGNEDYFARQRYDGRLPKVVARAACGVRSSDRWLTSAPADAVPAPLSIDVRLL